MVNQKIELETSNDDAPDIIKEEKNTRRNKKDKDGYGSNSNDDKYEIGRLWSMEKFGKKHYYEYIVSLSIFFYWTLVSIIPIYNKIFFQKKYYPYPIATAGIQLFAASTISITINTIQYYCCSSRISTKRSSWIFGPNFLWKLKWVAPIGILFGLKYGITNKGLDVVPASTHLLLQGTDLVWTLLAAWYINGERVTPVGMICLLFCIAGTICTSIQINETITAPIYAICINLTSPILLGLCITTLRSACMGLMRGENAISSMELTALKLMLSCTIAFIMAMIFEIGHANTTTLSWYDAFAQLPTSTKLYVVGGAIPILLFQVNCTFLVFLTSSVSLGLVGQVKILPQWTLALLFAPNTSQHFHFNVLNIAGAVLTIISAAAFAWNNYITIHDYENDVCGSNIIVENTSYVGNEEHARLLDYSFTASSSSNYSAVDVEDPSC